MPRYLSLVLSLLLILASCNTAEPAPTSTPTLTPSLTPTVTNTPAPTPTSRPSALELSQAADPSQQAYISAVSVVPDSVPFDVYIDRLAVATNLDFGRSTLPSGIVAGDYTLRLIPSGTGYNADTALLEAPISIKGGDSTLLMFTGVTNALEITTIPLSQAPLASSEARVTFIHGIPNGPEVSLQQQDGIPLTGNLQFTATSLPVTLSSGDTTLNFMSGPDILFSHPVNLIERFSYTFVLVGSAADLENLNIVTINERMPGSTSLRAVNGSAAVGPVDIYVDDQPLATNLDHTRVSERQNLAARAYRADVFAAGENPREAVPLLTVAITPNDDDVLTLILLGEADDLSLVPYREDLSVTNPLEARIAFVNTVPQVSRVRIDTQSRVLDEVGNINYGQPPRPVDISTGTYRFAWLVIENNEPVDTLEIALDVQLEPGFSYLYLATGRIDDPPVILSESVGINESLVGLDDGVIPTPIPDIPTRARFVNAIKGGLPLDVLVDNQTIFSGLEYGATTVLTPFAEGEHEIEIRFTSTGEAIAFATPTFEFTKPYTLVVHGFGSSPVEILTLDDSDIKLTGDSAHFRLINASITGETSLGLAVSRTDTPSNTMTLIGESPTNAEGRRSFAFGIERVPNLTQVAGRDASAVILAPLGAHDLHVTDDKLDLIAASFRGADLSPATHYDIIVYQNIESPIIEGFAVRYPGG